MKWQWMALFLCLSAAVSCKSGSKKSSSSKPPVDNTADTQRRLQEMQQNGTRTITLGGQSAGSTVSVASTNLDSVGGLPLVINGISSSQLMVGLLTGPQGLRITNTGGSYTLAGQFPPGVTTGISVTILARDKSKCTTANDCNALPDAQGRLTSTQIVPNPSWDVQAQFYLSAGTPGTGVGTLDPTTPPVTPDPSTGGGQSIWSQFFTNPIGAIKSGANAAWTYLKGLFS